MLNESRTPKRARTNSKAPIDRVRKTKPLEKISLSPKRKVLTRSRSVKHMRTDSEELNCALAKCIDSDTLKIVCEKLEAKDLVNLIASCQFFKRGRGRDIIDSVSEKVVDDELGECPGFVRQMNNLQRMSIIEKRSKPLLPSDIKVSAWVRVKKDLEHVKQLCTGNTNDDDDITNESSGVLGNVAEDMPEPDYAVGWEEGMEDTVGKCFEVAVVSKAYRSTPVVGLCVGTGLVAIGGENNASGGAVGSSRDSDSVARAKRAKKQAAMNKYGWYFPLEALEHI